MNTEQSNIEDLTEYEADELAEKERSTLPKKERLNLEQQLFAWEEWDDMGAMSYQFYNVELVVPVGDFPIGTKFDIAYMDGDNSTVSFMNTGDNHINIFELHLSVGKKIEK